MGKSALYRQGALRFGLLFGNGLESSYSNLAALPTVEIGDEVSVGDVIGSVGSTAIGEINEQSHLHLSVTLNGESADPLNYLPDQP